MIDLAYFEGLTHAEIAKTTGLPLGTVKTRLSAAVRHLRSAAPGCPQDALPNRVPVGRQRAYALLRDRALHRLADIYFLDVVAESRMVQRTAWGHVDPAIEHDLDQIWRFVPAAACEQHPVRQVMDTGRPQFVSHTSTTWQNEVAMSVHHLQFMQRLQMQSLISQPVAHGGRLIGALTVVRTKASGAHYREQDFYETRQVAAVIGASLPAAR